MSLGMLSYPKISEYISNVALSSLSPDVLTDLVRLFSEEELLGVISALKPNKSPGPGGFKTRFYTFFQGPLSSILTKTYNVISGDTTFSARALEAHISFIQTQQRYVLMW